MVRLNQQDEQEVLGIPYLRVQLENDNEDKQNGEFKLNEDQWERWHASKAYEISGMHSGQRAG